MNKEEIDKRFLALDISPRHSHGHRKYLKPHDPYGWWVSEGLIGMFSIWENRTGPGARHNALAKNFDELDLEILTYFNHISNNTIEYIEEENEP